MTQHSEKNVQETVDVTDSKPVATHGEKQSKMLRRDLHASLIDGAAFGGMVGFGETYFSAFSSPDVVEMATRSHERTL